MREHWPGCPHRRGRLICRKGFNITSEQLRKQGRMSVVRASECWFSRRNQALVSLKGPGNLAHCRLETSHLPWTIADQARTEWRCCVVQRPPIAIPMGRTSSLSAEWWKPCNEHASWLQIGVKRHLGPVGYNSRGTVHGGNGPVGNPNGRVDSSDILRWGAIASRLFSCAAKRSASMWRCWGGWCRCTKGK